MRTALVVAAAVVVAGCTTGDLSGRRWTKVDVSTHQRTLDDLQCSRTAARPVGTYESWVGGLADLGRIVVEQGQRYGLYARCMAARGYARSR